MVLSTVSRSTAIYLFSPRGPGSPLARHKRVQPLPDFCQFGTSPLDHAILFEGGMDGFDQVIFMHGFGEKIDGSLFRRLYTHRNVTVASEKDDR